MVEKNDYLPFPNRKEHDFVNEATVIISKQRLIIRDAVQTTDRLQALIDEHIKTMRTTRKDDGGR